MSHMFYDGNFLMGGMHFLWGFFWLALLGVILFYGRARINEQRRHLRESPHEILQQHLASGEITPEQYEERKVLLDRDVANKA